jgi:hypothetical protein
MPITTGVPAQTVQFTLTTLNGRVSNAWPAIFVPSLELKKLTWQDVNVVSCSNQGVTNACNNVVTAYTQSAFCPTQTALLFVASFSSVHYGCWGGVPDQGMDTYSVNLTNGWAIASFVFTPTYVGPNEVVSVSPPGFSANSVSIYWYIPEDGGVVGYSGLIGVKGPAGVPFH